ncbi:MAG: Gfo/Idh/MocA family oxidoreductase [Planctomycetaceae bacterium]
MSSFDFLVVGLGHQSLDDHIPAIQSSDDVHLAGVVDTDIEKAARVGKALAVPFAKSISEFLKENPKPTAALVAIPHVGYLEAVCELAEAGIHILKEKPLAVSLKEALQMKAVVEANNVLLSLTLQRRYNPVFQSFPQLLRRIGRIFSIEAKYALNISRLDCGWRASRLYSGGGALIDLGYHYVDLIVWYFGLPDLITCRTSMRNRVGQEYDVEDTAFVNFSYCENNPGEEVLGSLIVSRVYGEKDEHLVAHGTKGMACVRRGKIARHDIDGTTVESMERFGAWPSALADQIEDFAKFAMDNIGDYDFGMHYLEQVAFVDAAYESARTGLTVNPRELLGRSLNAN